MGFVKVKFFGGSFAVSQVLCKTSTVFAVICKITTIASIPKRPLGMALDEDEGGSFDIVVGKMMCV